jgi:hypothetical protein
MARNRRGIEEGISVQLHREAVDSTVDPAVTLPANDFAGAVGGIYALANSGMSESRSPADLCRRVLHHLIPGKRLRSAASKKESGIRCFSGISLGDRGTCPPAAWKARRDWRWCFGVAVSLLAA